MPYKTVKCEQIADDETRRQCNELLLLLSQSNSLESIEQVLSVYNQLNSYLTESISSNTNFYSALELEFLINLIQQLCDKIEDEKQLLGAKLINKQKSKDAVNKYKSNF